MVSTPHRSNSSGSQKNVVKNSRKSRNVRKRFFNRLVKIEAIASSTRICLKVCAPRFCFKVCAFTCYSMVDWLIDWVRGYASKSAHTKNRYFPETNRLNSANSSLLMGIVMILRIKQKWRRNLRWFPTKNGKKYKQRLLNQSINHRITWECVDFESYPRTVFRSRMKKDWPFSFFWKNQYLKISIHHLVKTKAVASNTVFYKNKTFVSRPSHGFQWFLIKNQALTSSIDRWIKIEAAVHAPIRDQPRESVSTKPELWPR